MTIRNKSKDTKIRTNVTTACTNCQNRKVRCSGNYPCMNCVKYKKHDECNFMSPYRRRGPKKKIGEIITSGRKRLMMCYQNYTIDQQNRDSPLFQQLSFQESNFFSGQPPNFFGSSGPQNIANNYYVHTNHQAP